MFIVINLQTNEPLSKENGEPYSWEHGGFANAMANEATERTGIKHQVRRKPASKEEWQKREAERFAAGFYVRPSWLDEYRVETPLEHYLHVSKNDPSKIAFTANDEKGAADIQTPMRVAAYLLQHATIQSAALSEHDARFLATCHSNIYAPKIYKEAKTADEIQHVYESGPNSCMAKPLNYFESSVHPVRVYGDSDLSLAYLENEDGSISARALIWQEKKIYGRVYGDENRLIPSLIERGFSAGSFCGAKIREIMCSKKSVRVLPYLDNDQHLKPLNNGFLEIVEWGEITACNTNGLEQCGSPCENCGDTTDEDDLRLVYYSRNNANAWCECCRDNGAFYCHRSDEYVQTECATYVEDEDEMVADWILEREYTYCEITDQWTRQDCTTFKRQFKRLTHNGYVNDLREITCRTDIVFEHAFECRIDGFFYDLELFVKDEWADEPRCILNEPTDKPVGYDEPAPFYNIHPAQTALDLDIKPAFISEDSVSSIFKTTIEE